MKFHFKYIITVALFSFNVGYGFYFSRESSYLMTTKEYEEKIYRDGLRDSWNFFFGSEVKIMHNLDETAAVRLAKFELSNAGQKKQLPMHTIGLLTVYKNPDLAKELKSVFLDFNMEKIQGGIKDNPIVLSFYFRYMVDAVLYQDYPDTFTIIKNKYDYFLKIYNNIGPWVHSGISPELMKDSIADYIVILVNALHVLKPSEYNLDFVKAEYKKYAKYYELANLKVKSGKSPGKENNEGRHSKPVHYKVTRPVKNLHELLMQKKYFFTIVDKIKPEGFTSQDLQFPIIWKDNKAVLAFSAPMSDAIILVQYTKNKTIVFNTLYYVVE